MSFFRIDQNQTLYYQSIQGKAELPNLVFLHEGLGCCSMWGDFPGQLCGLTGCRGLVYDRSGYGKSSPCNQTRTIHYLHDYALQELPLLLNGVIPETPYILVGHSDGASISLLYGSQRPVLLRGIIAEAAHVFVEPTTISGIKSTEKAWFDGKMKNLTKYHGDKTEWVFKAWSQTWLQPWFSHWNIEYLLPSIAVPLLVIQGKNDQYGSPAQAEAIAANTSGVARLEMIEGSGHVPHTDAQQYVLKIMADFIKMITR